MTLIGWTQIALYVALIIALTRPVGRYLHHLATASALPGEAVFYRLAGVNPAEEQTWRRYAGSMLVFKTMCLVLSYALLRLQTVLPLNPAGQDSIAPDLALNTAISFLTNTNWQSFGGEATMSHFSQMAVLTVQNFLSAAAGVAIAFAAMRGFTRRSARTLGNFWVDLTRLVVHLLLPASLVLALVLVWQGVPQTLDGGVTVTTLEGASQTIALGAALTTCFGRTAGRERQGWAIFAAMGLLAGVAALYAAEAGSNPLLAAINLWLWFTLLFANFAEAVAEGRGRAQAASLRQGKAGIIAHRHSEDGGIESVSASLLRQGDIVEVVAGELIPSDGEVIAGAAAVNEAAITGESAPVIREAGGDRSAVTGGTQVVSDRIRVRITAAPGHNSFIDRMIALVEGASRQKTPNEIALNILLAGFTLIFVLAVATIPAFANYAGVDDFLAQPPRGQARFDPRRTAGRPPRRDVR